MKQQIIQNINDPEALEQLYRKDKSGFALDFPEASNGIETDLVRFWKIRLKKQIAGQRQQVLKNGLAIILVISVITAFLVRLPLLIKDINPEDFNLRNISILLFAALTAWFIIKNKITGAGKILPLALPSLGLTVFINLLPKTITDTTTLAIIHAPLFMGFIFALACVSLEFKNTLKVTGFIRYCGELFIMTGLLAIAGAILSGMTISLFEIIGMKIGHLYIENVAVVGVAVLPLIAAWLIDLYPGITDRIAPVIARIFTPLVFFSACIYLGAISVSRVSLSGNRELLLSFNIMLLCVMAIIVFSLSEVDKSNIRKLNIILLFLLVLVTLLIDLFALTAIIHRLTEGFTPNRTVVMVSNILILINLLLVLPDLFLAGFRGKELDRLERIITRYLPVYFIYSIVVVFIFPLIF